MLNLLNMTVWQYLKENVVLAVVLAIILVLIAALSVIMICLQVMSKKSAAKPEENTEVTATEEKAPETTEAPAAEVKEEPAPAEEPAPEVQEEPAPAEEPVPEVQEETAPAEEPAPEVQEETAPVQEPVPEVKEEPAPAEKPAPKAKPATRAKTAPKVKPVFQKDSEKKNDEDKSIGFQDGKWIIRKTEEGKFNFQLYASNGGIMLEGSKEYASLSTAKKGIETYKKNFEEDNCKIVATKTGGFVYRLTNANGMLLAVSSSYTSKSSCENALESTKRYALNAPVEVSKD